MSFEPLEQAVETLVSEQQRSSRLVTNLGETEDLTWPEMMSTLQEHVDSYCSAAIEVYRLANHHYKGKDDHRKKFYRELHDRLSHARHGVN